MDNLENIDVSNMDVSTMSKVIERLWPKFLDAGMNIVWAVLILIVGLKLISILRKFLKKTLLRGNVDTGVVQFLDALVKISAWTVLILSLLGHFGIQTTSFITILGSADGPHSPHHHRSDALPRLLLLSVPGSPGSSST